MLIPIITKVSFKIPELQNNKLGNKTRISNNESGFIEVILFKPLNNKTRPMIDMNSKNNSIIELNPKEIKFKIL